MGTGTRSTAGTGTVMGTGTGTAMGTGTGQIREHGRRRENERKTGIGTGARTGT